MLKTQEEAIERLLEVLCLKLHQLEDDKEGMLYNIKELKKKIKNPKNVLFLRKLNEIFIRYIYTNYVDKGVIIAKGFWSTFFAITIFHPLFLVSCN